MSNRHQTDNYRHWNDLEVNRLIQLAKNHSATEVAVLLGRTVKSVKQAALVRCISFEKNPRRSFHATEDNFIIANVGKMSQADIARHLDRTPKSVASRVNRLGLGRRYTPKYRCKYSDEDVELCRQLHYEGLPISIISEKMEIPKETVRQYIKFNLRINGLPEFLYDLREQR
ncbi:hypothetical protein ACFFUP_16030 [Vibrio ostreicida]|uniref:DNA-binding protein n=1 Tax=Vibrio ostreicida TaxID=526588 RepID=A0ABT8BSB9_9VIBR|nr:hypothetical protein [Vibrio ostreicida]MDN3610037.1 hypothetical protein [Vibrio ostreicida]MDN3611637.1 hypothetical protein [Vibrio ostreicida]MDN3611644.1 hypothetical protein [Vibrio ostreicida]NPD10996.1 hypothetical protein [Vibrio ostreicida]